MEYIFCHRLSSRQTWKWVLPSDCRALCKMYHSSTRPSLCCLPPWPPPSWSPRAAWRAVWGTSLWTPSPSWSLCNMCFLTRLAFCHLAHWRNSIPAINSVAVTNISYNLENRPTFHGHSWGKGFQLPTSNFCQVEVSAGNWAQSWLASGQVVGGPMYNTGQREPKPRSPHHFSSPTQKLPVLPKTCHVHPNVAGVNREMPISPKSCQFHTKVSVFLRKKFRIHPQPKVTGFILKLTSSTKSWFHLKVPGVT